MATARPKAHKGVGMEGFIAAWYARQTAKDLDEFKGVARRIAAHIGSGARVLEIAPGPGYLAIELVRLTGCRLVGVDISHTFVRIAGENARKEGLRIDFEQGDAADLPFPAEQFDFIVCRAAFKNFSQPVAAMNEMYRVLDPGGRALIVDLRKDASLEDINAYIRHADLGWASSIIYKATFRYLLLPRAYSKQQFADMAAESAFAGAHVDASGIGFEVTLQKEARGRSG